MIDLDKTFSLAFACFGIIAVLGYIILLVVAWYKDRKERNECIERRNHSEHEQMRVSQEAMQESMLHLANAVKALEKMVRVSHGLPDATKVKYKKKKDD